MAALLGPRPCPALAAEADLYVVLHYGVDASVRGCWDEAEFRRSVAHRIGYDPFRDDAAIDVRIRIGGSANAVDGQVEWRRANGLLMGERRFIAKDGNCGRLLTEMSFAVGLQIELLRPKAAAATAVSPPARGTAPAPGPPPVPATVTAPPPSSSASASPSSSGGSPSTGTPAPPTPPAPPAVAATPQPPDTEGATDDHSTEPRRRDKADDQVESPMATASSPWTIWVGAGPSLAWRMSPGPTGDGRLFVGIRRSDFSVELGAEATYPSTNRRWDGSGFRQSLIGGTLALCGHHQFLSACVLGRFGEARVTGLGVDEPRAPVGWVAQAGLRLAATLELGSRWFATARVEGLGLLTPCTVKLDQAEVWDMPRLGGLVGMDVAVRFQ